MADHPEMLHELSDDEWELQIAKIPPILRPKDYRTIPIWMLRHSDTFPKRFDTHFFLIRMPAGQEAAHDQLETTAGTWISPEEALARYGAGDFPLVFATIHQLRALSGLTNVAAACERFVDASPRTIMPRAVERDGQEIILLPDEE